MSVLTTDRLTLRPYQADEAALIHSLISDLRVFFWREEPGTLQEAHELLAAKRALFEDQRLGWWAVRRNDNDEFVGQVILQPLPETGEPEIGYHFRPEVQGLGYATEAAKALLDHGFRTLNLPRIVAVILPDNAPSQAVMAKLKLPYEKDIVKATWLHNYFALNAEDYIPPQD